MGAKIKLLNKLKYVILKIIKKNNINKNIKNIEYYIYTHIFTKKKLLNYLIGV